MVKSLRILAFAVAVLGIATACASRMPTASTEPSTQDSVSSPAPLANAPVTAKLPIEAAPRPATPRPASGFGNAVVGMPAFPAPWDKACPAGTRTFEDGYALITARPSGDDGNATGIHISDRIPAVVADLDGQPGDEAIVMIHCATEGQSPYTPFALKLDASGAVIGSLGFVAQGSGRPFLLSAEDKAVTVNDGVVLVEVLGEYGSPSGQRQTRGYAYRDGAFVQVSGPTKF